MAPIGCVANSRNTRRGRSQTSLIGRICSVVDTAGSLRNPRQRLQCSRTDDSRLFRGYSHSEFERCSRRRMIMAKKSKSKKRKSKRPAAKAKRSPVTRAAKKSAKNARPIEAKKKVKHRPKTVAKRSAPKKAAAPKKTAAQRKPAAPRPAPVMQA